MERDQREPLASLTSAYGEHYADSYRAAFDALPTGESMQQQRCRGEVAHWIALASVRTQCRRPAGGTLAAYATGYAEQQTAGACGNARAAREYAALTCAQVNA